MNIKVKALNISVILTLALITLMTIMSELSKPFKNFLIVLFKHHWIAKSILSLIFFILVYFLLHQFFKEEEVDIRKETILVMATTIICGLVIFGFYLWHFFFVE